MHISRTDMADERRGAIPPHRLEGISGLEVTHEELNGARMTRIEVKSEEASQAMDKPMGTYITIDLKGKWQQDNDLVIDMAHNLARCLRPLIPEGDVLVAGLGNRLITADALGPLACERVVVTRHLREKLPHIFGSMRGVACVTPGVMGQTGMEGADMVKGACRLIRPAAVIAIDALAALGLERLGNSFQLSTGGIIPGEGAGNRRMGLTMDQLGVPVISMGVPTVADASPMAGGEPGDFLVSPSDIDLLVARGARAIGYGINLALHGDMAVSDMEQMLA